MPDDIASLIAEAEKKKPEERTEEEKLAMLGKPRLGDISRAQIRIKESKEFKVSDRKILKKLHFQVKCRMEM